MAEYKDTIIRVAADDPMRCQANLGNRQCINKAVSKGGMCPIHGGNKIVEKEARARIRNYQVAKFQEKLNRHADSSEIKNLREEIGILRLLMEERLNRCKDEHDLLMESQWISDMVIKIEKLVKTCHGLEGAMGNLLDKQAILHYASMVVGIISDELSTVEGSDIIIERIGNRMTTAINKVTEDQDECIS